MKNLIKSKIPIFKSFDVELLEKILIGFFISIIFYPTITFSQNYLEWPKTHSEKVIFSENNFLFKNRKLNKTVQLKKPFVLVLDTIKYIISKVTIGEELQKPYFDEQFNFKNDGDLWDNEIIVFDKDGFPKSLYRIALRGADTTIYVKTHYEYHRYDSIADGRYGQIKIKEKIVQLIEVDITKPKNNDSLLIRNSFQYHNILGNFSQIKEITLLYKINFNINYQITKHQLSSIKKRINLYKEIENIKEIHCLKFVKSFHDGKCLIDTISSVHLNPYYIEQDPYRDISIEYFPLRITFLRNLNNCCDTFFHIECNSIQQCFYESKGENLIHFQINEFLRSNFNQTYSQIKSKYPNAHVYEQNCFTDNIQFRVNFKVKNGIRSFYYTHISDNIFDFFDSIIESTKNLTPFKPIKSVSSFPYTFESKISKKTFKKDISSQTIDINFPNYDLSNKEYLDNEYKIRSVGYNLLQNTPYGQVQFYVPHYLQLFFINKSIDETIMERKERFRAFTNKTIHYKITTYYYDNK